MNIKNYGLITAAPKIANPNIIPAGIMVIMDSFDMILLMNTW